MKRSKQPSKNQDAKRTRAARKLLREHGFISKHIDLRKPPSKAELKALKTYAPLIKGEAVVVPVPKGKAKQYRRFHAKGGHMLVPKQKGAKVKIDKKTGIPYYSKKGSKTFLPGKGGKPPPLAKGKKRLYKITFKNVKRFHKRTPKASDPASGTVAYDSMAGLAAFMASYEDEDEGGHFGDWMDYVEYEDYSDYDDFEGASEADE